MKPARFWEIDFARGIAVVLMIAFNYSVTLDYFKIFSMGGGWLYWLLFPRLVAGTFILLAGISFFIMAEKIKNFQELKRRSFLRGVKIFALGFLATAATFFLTPTQTIWFGILHFFGISFLLAPFFVNVKKLILPLGMVLIAAGFFLNTIPLSHSWLLWLGLPPANFQTFDYFPLLPWFGVFLLGIFLGEKFYSSEKRNIHFSTQPKILEGINFLGRHSLKIYVAHQPLLIILLFALGLASF